MHFQYCVFLILLLLLFNTFSVLRFLRAGAPDMELGEDPDLQPTAEDIEAEEDYEPVMISAMR